MKACASVVIAKVHFLKRAGYSVVQCNKVRCAFNAFRQLLAIRIHKSCTVGFHLAHLNNHAGLPNAAQYLQS